MLERMSAGEIPRKHHIAFRDEAGGLLHEECWTRDGFDGAYTIMYHQHAPHTQAAAVLEHGWRTPEVAHPQPLAKRHFRSSEISRPSGAPIDTRVPLLFNRDIVLGMVYPDREDPVYFSNGDADDLYYIFRGGGVLRSQLGDVRFERDDYVFVPRGCLHRMIPDEGEQVWLSMECKGGLHLLRQWRNETGQLRMDAPYCHRDFRRPEFRGPLDEGIRDYVVKRRERFHGFKFESSPLDVVGWDGAVYPWVFPILNFQPRAGQVHLPPTWHGTFGARGTLICSFVPRAVDFHPEAIPCPYPHASPDCDEFIFYVRGNFTSRRGIEPGSISYHPMGILHGPHPGAYEGSIGHARTEELAVMVDTLEPLDVTSAAVDVEDAVYQDSFR